jgi:glyoxylase-like metal-dependent hydrolase (beta-lactamase superfamily II)
LPPLRLTGVLLGDSVTILSAHGHMPGHQSLLVRLPKAGAVVLSGDVAHKDNFDNRRVTTHPDGWNPIGETQYGNKAAGATFHQ